MEKYTNKERRRLVKDSGEKVSRYKLYKSKTQWVIAGMTTIIFSVGLMTYTTTSASAAESGTATSDPTTTAVVTTDTTSGGSATLSSGTTTVESGGSSDTTSQETTDASNAVDTASETEAPAKTGTAAETGTSTNTDDDDSTTDNVASTADSENNTATGDTNTGTAQSAASDASSNDANQASSSATKVTTPDELNTNNTVTGTSVAKAKEVRADNTIEASNLTTTGVDVTSLGQTTAGEHLSRTTVKTVTDPSQIITAATYSGGPVAYFDGINYVVVNNTSINSTALPNTLLEWILANKDYVTNYTVSATNTRLINGVVTLTNKSVVSVTANPQKIAVRDSNTLLRSSAALMQNGTDDTKGLPSSIANGNDLDSSITDLWVSDTQKVGQSYTTSALTKTGNFEKYPTLVYAYQIDYSDGESSSVTHDEFAIRTYLAFDITTIALDPTITNWSPYDADGNVTNTTMAGTGTAAGDTITLYSDDGTKSLTTTVKDDNTWSVDLSGTFAANNGIYAVESNDLGDTPGAVAAIKYDVASRTITYKDAVTGANLNDPTKDPEKVVVSSTGKVQASSDGSTVDATSLKAIGITREAVIPANFDSIAAADLESFDGYIKAIQDISAEAVVAGSTINDDVYLYPTTVTVTPGDPKDPDTPTVPGDADSPKYPAGVTTSDLNKPVTETVNYVISDGGTTAPQSQNVSVNFTRTATITYKVVDGQYVATITYSDWVAKDSDDTLDAVSSPAVTGYIANVKTVPAVTGVTSDTKDSTVTVTYYPKTQTVTPDDPKTSGDSLNPNDPNAPVIPDGVEANDLNATVTETVHLIDHDTKQPVTDTDGKSDLTFTNNYERTATITYNYDANGKLVGTVTYGNYEDKTNGGKFAAVDAPTVTDYTAPAGQVGEVTRTVADGDFEKTIEYFDNDDLKHIVTINTVYEPFTGKDQNGNDVTTPSDTSTKVDFYRQPTFDAKTGNFTYTAWTTDTDGVSNDNTDLEKTIDAITLTVPDGLSVNVAIDTDGTTKTTANLANTGVTVIGDNTVITRTVNYVQEYYTVTFMDYTDPSKPVTLGEKQTVGNPFNSQVADVDGWGLLEIINDPQYLKDENGTIDGSGNEIFTGVAKGDYVIEVRHLVDEENMTTTRTINYVFEDGTTAAKSDVQQEIWTKNSDLYLLNQDGDSEAGSKGILYKQGADVYKEVTSPTASDASTTGGYDLSEFIPSVTIVPAGKVVTDMTATEPKDEAITVTYKRNIFTPENPGSYADQLTQTSTRVVHYINAQTGEEIPASVITPTTQVVTFTRTYNQQNNTYTDFTSDNATFAEVIVPDISGFVTTTTSVPEATAATPTDGGKTTINAYVDYYPATYTVTPNTPQDEGTLVNPNDPTGPKYPVGVDKDSLHKTVTSTVHYVNGNDLSSRTDMPADSVQTAEFERTATVHVSVVDGKYVTSVDGDYTDYVLSKTAGNDDVFASVITPTVAGKFADINLVPVVDGVTATTADKTTTVTYYNADVEVTPDEPKDPGTSTIPSDPANPDTPNNSPKYPSGVTETDLNQTVTQTVHYVNGADGNSQLAEDTTTTLTYSRKGFVHYDSNGQATVTYGNWVLNDDKGTNSVKNGTDETGTFVSVTTKTIKDYFTNTTATEEVTGVKATDADSSQTVVYYPATETIMPNDPKDENTSTVPGDDHSPKYPKGLTASDLNKTVTETIHYVDGVDGHTVVSDRTQTLTFSRQATVDYTTLDADGNATVTYGKWVLGSTGDGSLTAEDDVTTSFAAVKNPTPAGYLPQKEVDYPEITGITVSSTPVEATVKYYPTQVIVTPDKPKDPNTPTVPGDEESPKYPDGVREGDLNMTVTETIRYVDKETGKTVAPSVKQELIFNRTARVSYDVNGDSVVTYSAWTAVGTNVFPSVISPVISGMTPDQTIVDALTETSPANVSLVVYYTTDDVPTTTPTEPELPAEKPVLEVTPTPEEKPESPAETPAPNTQTPTETPETQPASEERLESPVEMPAEGPETQQPTPDAKPQTPVKQVAVKTKQTPGAVVTEKEQVVKTLPQTNDANDAVQTSVLGLLGLSLLGMVGLGKKRKRDEK